MKLAVFMDPFPLIKAYKDSTVAMLESAQKLGWECYFFTPHDLVCRGDQAFAHMHAIKVEDFSAVQWAEIRDVGEQPLSSFDIILVRKDPPFTVEYIYATYMLELAERAGVLVVNKPQSLRDANEKISTLQFPQCSPPTLVSANHIYLKEFWAQHREVIFKPLDAMGGQGIFHVTKDGRNLSVILEQLTHQETVPIMAQVYIPEIIKLGDKRILLINGAPIPYALARIPAPGEFRGNLAAGGKGKVVPINDRDRWICEQIAPMLQVKGLYFVGIDVIGDYLTEINVTSPTCIREINAETGLDIANQYMQFLEELVLKS